MFILSDYLFAQQAPMTTQYMFNTLLINPAYAGSKPFTSATMMVRKQWAGFKGSPTTETASIHGALEDKNVGLGLYIKNVGLGLYISNDHAGIINRTELFGSYSYTIEYGESKLAFGLQAGLSYLKSTLSDLVYNDNNDPVYEKNTINNVLPNFGAGLYYHTDLFYAGISAPLLLSYDPLKSLSLEMTDVHHIRRHYFLTTGYVFSIF